MLNRSLMGKIMHRFYPLHVICTGAFRFRANRRYCGYSAVIAKRATPSFPLIIIGLRIFHLPMANLAFIG